MNETERIDAYLTALETSLKNGSELEQAPQAVQEYLNWYWAEALFWFATGGVMFVVCSVVLYQLWRVRCEKVSDEESILRSAVAALSVSLLIVSVVMLLVNTYQMLRVSVAPRVVLLKEISDLL